MEVKNVLEEDKDGNEDESINVVPPENLGRGKRVRQFPKMYAPTHSEQRYESVWFTQVKGAKIDCEADRIKSHFAGRDKVPRVV